MNTNIEKLEQFYTLSEIQEFIKGILEKENGDCVDFLTKEGLWFEVTSQGKNKKFYIDIKDIYDNHLNTSIQKENPYNHNVPFDHINIRIELSSSSYANPVKVIALLQATQELSQFISKITNLPIVTIERKYNKDSPLRNKWESDWIIRYPA